MLKPVKATLIAASFEVVEVLYSPSEVFSSRFSNVSPSLSTLCGSICMLDIQLGQDFVSAIQNSRVSAFQRLKYMAIYGNKFGARW